jgi:hypothetical protein
VLANELRLEGPLPIARHNNRQRPVVGQHRLTARPVAMIRRLVGLGAAGRIAEMVTELGARSMMAFLTGFICSAGTMSRGRCLATGRSKGI